MLEHKDMCQIGGGASLGAGAVRLFKPGHCHNAYGRQTSLMGLRGWFIAGMLIGASGCAV
ncbi:hypothetical protein AA0475_0142 [Acetobacter peroxydans]|nr:hypothetical protein AA0475_0142 [Acetobacter peroxydans]